VLFKAPNRLCVSLAAGARPVHPIRDAGLSDLKAELEQFAMNARRAPMQIFNAHPPNQGTQICTDLRPASQVARFPTPIAAKTGTMPAHQRLGPDDPNDLEDRRKPAIQLDEDKAITVGELDPTVDLPLQHDQLLPERGIR
jgi:hypothetical protein